MFCGPKVCFKWPRSLEAECGGLMRESPVEWEHSPPRNFSKSWQGAMAASTCMGTSESGNSGSLLDAIGEEVEGGEGVSN